MDVITLHYSGTSKEEKNLPDEDCLSVTDNSFAVFDGVPTWFQDPYPNPSPGGDVARLAAESITKYLASHNESIVDIVDAFKQVNKQVASYNAQRGVTNKTVNHRDKQYGAAVGSFGFVKDNLFYFGQLNDCGVMAFDKEENRELDIINNGQDVLKYFKKRGGDTRFDATSPSEHVNFRTKIVNNPDAAVDGEKISFGVMTGETIAEKFLRTGVYPIIPGSSIIIFSDGFIPFLYDKDFVHCLLSSSKKTEIEKLIEQKIPTGEKFQKEKTLVMISF